MNNKKVLALSVVAVAVLVVAIVATSYAMFTANLTGTQENKLNTGYVTLSCTETNFDVKDTNPMTDVEGIAQTDNVATCTLASTMVGTMTVGYDIAMTDVDIDNPTDNLGESNVKIQATKSVDSAAATYLVGTAADKGVLVSDIANSAGIYDTSITGYTLDSAKLTGNHSVVYTIKTWVTSLGDSENVEATAEGVCSDTQYNTETDCEGAGEIWGNSQTSTQEGGAFSFKLKVGATQTFPTETPAA